MNIIDILILLLIIFQIRAGYKRGFILTAFGFAGNLIAFFLSYIYKDGFKLFLIRTMKLDEMMYGMIHHKVLEFTQSLGSEVKTQNQDLLKSFPLPQAIKDQIFKQIDIGSQSVAQEITHIIVDFSITILSAIVLYILIKIMIKFIAGMLDLVAKLPIINGFNKIGGVVISLGIIYLELILISNSLLMLGTFIHTDWFLETISSSVLIKHLLSNPVFIKFI